MTRALLLSRGAAFTPANYPGLNALAWWHAATGANATTVDTYTDAINSYPFTATTTLRPTFSPTSIVDENGGTHPGITFNGANGMVCSAAGLKTAVSALSGIHVLANLQGVTGTLQVILEWSASFFSQAGAFGLFANDAIAGMIEAASSGAGAGLGLWKGNSGTAPFIDPGVVQVSFGNVGGGVNYGSTAQLLDGFQMLGTTPNTAWSTVAYSSQNLYLGARAQSTLFMTGTIGDILLLPPTATATQLQWARAYMGMQIGAVQG
jgi:hypothetical protein